MVEAGANEVPDEKLLEAFDLAHQEIRKLCQAQEELRAQAGKPKWLDSSLTEELENEHGHAMWTRIQEDGLREAAAVVDEIVDQLAPPLTMEATDEDVLRGFQARQSLHLILEQRLVACEGPVWEQFEPSCARSPTPSRTRRSCAPPSGRSSSTGSSTASSFRSQSGRPPSTETRRRSATDSRSSSYEGRRRDLQRTSSARRSPSTSGARTAAAPRRSARSSATSA